MTLGSIARDIGALIYWRIARFAPSTATYNAVTTVPLGARVAPSVAPAPGLPALLRASAIQLDNWSRHIACPAAIYCDSLSRQLRAAADGFEK